MSDNLGIDVMKLQKEIIDITKNINTVRMKTHKSMSSILKGLKSFSRNNSSKTNHNSSSKNDKNRKIKKLIEDNNIYIIKNEEDCKIDKNYYNYLNHKKKVNNLLLKCNKGILLNEYEHKYDFNNIKEKSYKNYLLVNDFNKKRNKKQIKYQMNNYIYNRNKENNKDFSNYENHTYNDNNIYKIIDKNRKKAISKTDSLKYLYKGNKGNNYYNNYTYYGDNKKSRNKNECNKKKDESLSFEYDYFLKDKASKTFYDDAIQKQKNKYQELQEYQNNAMNINYQKSYKNIFRKKASTKASSNENNHNIFNIYNDYYPHKKVDDIENINNIYKILNAKNYKDCLHKINKLLSYENFIHNMKKLYFQFNDNNNDFSLKDILFWISFHINNDNKINKYEEFCKEIMAKYDINNFEHLKIFFKKLVNEDKNNKSFVKGMKEIFNNFNDFQPNKSIYSNTNRKKFQNVLYRNEDDINN